eukprot:GHVS01096022.1.p1 GENE.GHVS01096022.1~~GHVS01096022.1.p1  ORF type:complete len:454 (+),score=64.75 GHVS01096022.1:53-1414(+)
MDEEYDVVVCGTGLKESILSGLLSVHGNKVLHIDANAYYGGESASLNLTNLYQKFRPNESPPVSLGANRDWNVDLVPKFVMACGQLVKMLLHTKVTRYLEWQVIEGTFVYQYQKAGLFTGPKYIHKVPASDREALTSPLMGLLEKNRCKNFFQYCANWEHDKPLSWKGFDPQKQTMEELFNHFGLHPNTIDFVGHAVALYTNDNYIRQPLGPTLEKIKLYMHSISRYGKSPFIYPLYGLGGLPEGFTRLCAIHGGTYMLNKPIEGFVYGDDGKVIGVKSKDGEVAKCKKVVCDPTYLYNTSKIRLEGKVIRCICLLNEPIPHTNDSTSCQVIIPQKQVNRHHDLYITLVSATHGVAAKGKFIALVSTTVETDRPDIEIKPALDLLGPIQDTFVQISDMWIPTDDGTADNVYCSSSYDPTSHFESAAEDVLQMWKNMQGSELDLTVTPDESDEI